VPEGVVDGGRVIDSGHESSPGGRRGRQRPDGVPEGFVFDRKSREWRMPKKPGPKSDDPDPQSASEDDGGWQAGRDPDPAHLSGDDSGPGGGAGQDGEIPQEVADDVAGLLGLLAVPIGAVAAARDPYCGAVFASQLPAIVDAAVPIVCRSERVLAWMTAGTGGLMDWIGLAAALAPVGRAFAEHHILRTVQLVDEDQDQEQEPVAA
jgi:hypothetical protein